MSGKMDWRKAGFHGKSMFSIKDEFEKRDAAAVWLRQHQPQPQWKKRKKKNREKESHSNITYPRDGRTEFYSDLSTPPWEA